MRGNAQPYQPQISTAAAKSQLAMLLCNTTDEKLAAFAADDLARIFRVKPAEICDMLALAREQRAERARCDRHGW